ncbi:MAG: hypothetical protein K5697_08880 [Lachnospiraceae bacterium]|nr:hypothetical protein [Lachnospiraceae bacterium]
MSIFEEYLAQSNGTDETWHDVYSEHNEHADDHTDSDTERGHCDVHTDAMM